MSDKYPSVSPYLYCAGNPIRFVDPTGMVIAIHNDDDDKDYIFSKSEDGSYGFYCEGKKLTSVFANDVTDALCTIKKNFFGNYLVDYIMLNYNIVQITYDKYQNGAYIFSCDKILWNPEIIKGGLNINGNLYRPPFIGLAHELGHIMSCWSNNPNRTNVWFYIGENEIYYDEKFACFWENLIRTENNIPIRNYYLHIEVDIFLKNYLIPYENHRKYYKGIEETKLFTWFDKSFIKLFKSIISYE